MMFWLFILQGSDSVEPGSSLEEKNFRSLKRKLIVKKKNNNTK